MKHQTESKQSVNNRKNERRKEDRRKKNIKKEPDMRKGVTRRKKERRETTSYDPACYGSFAFDGKVGVTQTGLSINY
jgi:hypothetical protein